MSTASELIEVCNKISEKYETDGGHNHPHEANEGEHLHEGLESPSGTHSHEGGDGIIGNSQHSHIENDISIEDGIHINTGAGTHTHRDEPF